MQDKYFLNASAVKTFSVIEKLCAEGEMGITEISRVLKLNKSTTHRIVSTLEHLGYVRQKSHKGKYSPTLKILTVASQIPPVLSPSQIAHPFLEKLSKLFKETTNLAVLENGKVVYVDKVESSETLRLDLAVGRRVPAYPTALGKALLAHLPSAQLEQILPKALTRFTKKTITDPMALRKELEEARKNGYAIDDEELNLGIRCIGAPIFDQSDRAIAAISIAGPSVRLTRKQLKIMVGPLKSTAKAISEQLR
jgi:DNA-binding IclR family transcriptional regulator